MQISQRQKLKNKVGEEVYPVLLKMPHQIWGITYRCSLGNYHVAINSRLAANKQKEVFLHELYHIKNCKENFILGIDMQMHDLEKEADRKAKEGTKWS